ncbi:hypothetical protein NDU88_006912 [Pleurodeles waltl]|uniref:Uncharacterized protein n=1 Tax=Pleurodeles waltl TaxID=8319 RepID=A0AAV7L532_PLEWA|nr:hypothetical protein NDU88_006912 [Pleurodeles waltl]
MMNMYSGHLILVRVQPGEPADAVTVFTLTMYSGNLILACVETGEHAGVVTVFTDHVLGSPDPGACPDW